MLIPKPSILRRRKEKKRKEQYIYMIFKGPFPNVFIFNILEWDESLAILPTPGTYSFCQFQFTFKHLHAPHSTAGEYPYRTCSQSYGRRLLLRGYFTHETVSPWPLNFKHSHWWKWRSRSKFASHNSWGTNGVCECKMDVKSTWIPTWHRMDHVSWSLGLLSKTTSWR
jgi:hypothetical protein